VRDFTGAGTAPFRVEFDVRTVYDFVLSLSDDAGSTDDLPAADRAWLEASKSSLPDSIRTDLAQLFGTEHCVVISTFVVDRPEIKTAAQLVDALKAASTVEIARTLLGQHLPTPELKAAGDQALAGDQAQIDTVLAAIHEQKRSTAERVLSDPAAIAGAVVGVLEAWLDRFVPIEDRVAAMLRRDVADRATDIANLNPIDLIERTTGGIRLLPEPWVRRVILAPSYFARPYNFVFAVGDWRQFSYPIADTALDAADPLAPPQAIVRLHRALGDETRLRILRLLRDRDWYLTEIAQQLELSKPTIKHHLAQLRAAGLVTLTEEGGLSYYSLRRQRLDDASVDLKRFLVDA
jgi:DNA-binding transcriptional ArsR family regulator